MGCVFVHDKVKIQIAWNSGFDLIEKLAELNSAMALVTLPDDRPVAMSRAVNRHVALWRL